MGTHKKSDSAVRKGKAAAQFFRTAANKIRKQAKHLKKVAPKKDKTLK